MEQVAPPLMSAEAVPSMETLAAFRLISPAASNVSDAAAVIFISPAGVIVIELGPLSSLIPSGAMCIVCSSGVLIVMLGGASLKRISFPATVRTRFASASGESGGGG